MSERKRSEEEENKGIYEEIMNVENRKETRGERERREKRMKRGKGRVNE